MADVAATQLLMIVFLSVSIVLPILISLALKRARLLAILSATLGANIAVAFFFAIAFSLIHWGYWPTFPDLDKRVSSATVTAMNTFSSDGSLERDLTPLPNEYPTENPIPYTLHQMKTVGLQIERNGKPPIPYEAILELPKNSEVRVKSAPGYDTSERFYGFWTELSGSDGNSYLFVVGNGAQVSNDHYPHYRLLYQKSIQDWQLVDRQVMYYDVAGLERATWLRAFIAALVPAALLAVAMSASCERLRERKYSGIN